MDNLSVVIDFLLSVSGCVDLAIRLFGVMVSLAVVFGCFTGVVQAAWRFGLALFGKKIQVIAGEADYQDIYEDLTDSGLIQGRNIQRISDKHQAKTRDALFLIVVYKYLKSNDFEAVIRGKARVAVLSFTALLRRGVLSQGRWSSSIRWRLPCFATSGVGWLTTCYL